MDVFFIGIITMLAFVGVFFVVFLGLIIYWHLTRTTVVIVPLAFTFELLFWCTVIVAITAAAINYLPVFFAYLNL